MIDSKIKRRERFLAVMKTREKKWCALQRLRGEPLEWNDIVCFCYEDYYLQVKLGQELIQHNEYEILLYNAAGFLECNMWKKGKRIYPRYRMVFLVQPAYLGKFEPVIKKYE